MPLWCRVSPVLVVCGAGVLVSLCVGCCVFLAVCCLCCVLCVYCFGCLVVWLCPRFCGVASCVVVSCCWCVLLLVARVFLVVFLLLLVLFCFGLSAVLWSSWCWLCVVALLSVLLLLVGCRGCVALSAFLLLVVLLVCFSSCALHRPGVGCSWFVCFSSGSFGGSWLGCFAPPLFHDPGCPGPAPGLTQNATWLGWLCGVSAPGGLWEFVSVCFHVVLVVFEFVYSVWCVSGSAFYSL